MAMSVIGWKLDRKDRARLLERFPPVWPDVVADHVTLDAHAASGRELPPEIQAEIVGMVDDGRGLQALVVAVNGSTDRPDGGTYHITWSLDRRRGRKPVHSNAVLKEIPWERLDISIPISVLPARWP